MQLQSAAGLGVLHTLQWIPMLTFEKWASKFKRECVAFCNFVAKLISTALPPHSLGSTFDHWTFTTVNMSNETPKEPAIAADDSDVRLAARCLPF